MIKSPTLKTEQECYKCNICFFCGDKTQFYDAVTCWHCRVKLKEGDCKK